MAFSGGDARFLVCMTGEPDYQIIFLDIARMKVNMFYNVLAIGICYVRTSC